MVIANNPYHVCFGLAEGSHGIFIFLYQQQGALPSFNKRIASVLLLLDTATKKQSSPHHHHHYHHLYHNHPLSTPTPNATNSSILRVFCLSFIIGESLTASGNPWIPHLTPYPPTAPPARAVLCDARSTCVRY